LEAREQCVNERKSSEKVLNTCFRLELVNSKIKLVEVELRDHVECQEVAKQEIQILKITKMTTTLIKKKLVITEEGVNTVAEE